MKNSNFYTLKGYKLKENNIMTEAMEDYLEMISRHNQKHEFITIKDLSFMLNVKPSSVSKMANRLKDSGFIYFHKYGKITLTEEGLKTGNFLLWRHHILKKFFKYINKNEYKLDQVEKLEHFFDNVTLKNIDLFLKNTKNKT